MEHRLEHELDREEDVPPSWWYHDTAPRYCACGNELTLAERERGETECGECR